MSRLTCFLLVLVCAACAGPAAPAPQRPMHLFLLAGQSNMAGRGTVTDADRISHPRILMLDAEMRWVPAVHPVHFDKPVAGVGPGLSFARVLVERDPQIVVGLIPAAVGGSPILSWRPGAVHDQTGTPPYDDALARARAAAAAGELKAILWHQGESDANPRLSTEYEARLRDLIGRFRQDLARPELPFLIGQLGQWPERPWTDAWKRVDEAHRRIGGAVPGAAYVSSAGLPHRGDTLHFSSEAARELGRRYAEAYLRLQALPGGGAAGR